MDHFTKNAIAPQWDQLQQQGKFAVIGRQTCIRPIFRDGSSPFAGSFLAPSSVVRYELEVVLQSVLPDHKIFPIQTCSIGPIEVGPFLLDAFDIC